MARRKRKVSSFQRCVAKKLRGKKGGRAAFKKAVKACAKGKAHKKSRRHRRRR